MIAVITRGSKIRSWSDRSIQEAKTWQRRRESLRDAFQAIRYASLRKSNRQPEPSIAAAMAVASAAITRCCGIEPYPTQVHAAHWMARGAIVDMATGEGKSIAVLLAALSMTTLGYGVHIATANEYLAQRDRDFAIQIAEQLGLTCSCIPSTGSEATDRQAYQSDLTFGTLAGFAFDHLRDELAIEQKRRASSGTTHSKPVTHSRRHRLIIDEIDHCLLDEASTPFVIADAAHDSIESQQSDESLYQAACEIAKQMQSGVDFEQTAALDFHFTPQGLMLAQQSLPQSPCFRPWTDYLLNALRAAYGLQQDVDYAVDQSQLRLIDKATGRFADGRQWQAGLHQAVQCHLGLPIDPEHRTVAQITARQFVSLYHQVSGCSGTALDGKQEFAKVYRLDVQRIPERLPSRRTILAPQFFADQTAKWKAIEEEVIAVNQQQRPVLVGTRSIAQSQQLAEQLRAAGLKVQLLNGTQTRAEADVIAHAGQRSMITVATDMAGRGTDIPIEPQVALLGGLHVIVSELSRSPRIDRQLIGRTARQGQPGTARVFVAADDELVREHAPALQRFLVRRLQSSSVRRWLWDEVLRAGDRSERLQCQRREAIALSEFQPHQSLTQ